MKFRPTPFLAGLLLTFCVSNVGVNSAFAEAQSTATQGAATAVRTDDLPIQVSEIIRRFAAHESQFRVERGNYTYSQSVTVEDGEAGGPLDGKYRMDSDIVFTPQGKRYEQVTFAPPNALRHIVLTKEDLADLENVQPFVLTTEDMPKYDVQYAGRERVDELGTYVFKVAPKRLEKNQRYFQGTIWVDDHDLAVVKSDGKAVPEVGDQRFPRFVTYRENIEGNFWFPTYTHADDILHFKDGDLRIRMTVRYSNYKRYGVTIKVGESKEIPNPPSPQEPSR